MPENKYGNKEIGIFPDMSFSLLGEQKVPLTLISKADSKDYVNYGGIVGALLSDITTERFSSPLGDLVLVYVHAPTQADNQRKIDHAYFQGVEFRPYP